MKFGILLPHAGRAADPDALVAVAQAAEDAGFDSVWVGDHVVLPQTTSTYPYADDGRYPLPADRPFLEAFTTLGFVAGATSRVQLGVSVCVVPHRPIALLAKVTATLDFLSRGRAVLGVGSGWSREEIEALGMPFHRRGAFTDEALAFSQAAWGAPDGRLSFHGEFIDAEEMYILPRPPQGSALPIWVGGDSRAARRRAARFGSVWFPPLWGNTADGLRSGLAEIRSLAHQNGRADTGEIGLATVAPATLDEPETDLWPGAVTGPPGRFAHRLEELAEAGVSHIVFLVGGSGARRVEFIARFRAEVIPLLRPAPSIVRTGGT
jgi:probable F420-dependent oxidoreductase